MTSMENVTAMRLAFAHAKIAPTTHRGLVLAVESALRRKLGVIRRRSMWSVSRAKR